MSKESIVVSFSGGLTSGNLSYIIKMHYAQDFEPVFIFANTGCENEETLNFVNQCDIAFGLNVIWVEAVVNPEDGKGITHRVTNFKDAFRSHQYKDPLHPFHAHIMKSGIPNANKPQCSDRLKALVIEDYKKKNGLKGVKHAIGIRQDEMRRVINKPAFNALVSIGLDPHSWRVIPTHKERLLALNEAIDRCLVKPEEKAFKKVISYSSKLAQYNLVYPLSDWVPSTKQDVNDFWEDQPFTLELEDHEGNCMTCWKKSHSKLLLIAAEHPERFDAFDYWEKNYNQVKPNDDGKPRVFFRKHKNAQHIIEEANSLPREHLRMAVTGSRFREDMEDGCSESCESYSI
ncbi:MAG: hypothetical protein CBC55_05030 [Gammaproteobacteria bacterium TMED95]|nr:MAG: hypothetical protein CBC55_05030 [Gammaproteobacteria bacterium TMED95]|tara:strand:- start:7810 stop:8844 length:1035 start_codon:yes stop_codon:yes gene_type:complete